MLKTPFVFFGEKHQTLDHLKATYRQWQFHTLHQVHGIDVVQSSLEVTKADGHWTENHNIAICVQTADCLPVLAWDKDQNRIFSIHAGWRGLVAGILPATFRELRKPSSLVVWIGPHIRHPSFLVREDVVAQFPQKFVNRVNESQYSVDLTAMALDQLHDLGIQDIETSAIDTHESSQHHSYRREKTPGRQWSFIVFND
jgi:YfiH family protein